MRFEQTLFQPRYRPSAKNVGLKAIEIGSPVKSISIASVAWASSPAPASSDSVLFENPNVVELFYRSQGQHGEQSLEVLQPQLVLWLLLLVGSKWRYGGNVPSNIRDVIVFPSPAKPAKRSLLVFGAKDNETSLEPVKDFCSICNCASAQ